MSAQLHGGGEQEGEDQGDAGGGWLRIRGDVEAEKGQDKEECQEVGDRVGTGGRKIQRYKIGWEGNKRRLLFQSLTS